MNPQDEFCSRGLSATSSVKAEERFAAWTRRFIEVGEFFVDIHQHDAKEGHHGLKTVRRNGRYPTRKKQQPSADLDLLATPPHDFGNILDIYLALLPWVGISYKPKKKSELRNEAERSFKQFDFNHDGTIDGGELMTCF